MTSRTNRGRRCLPKYPSRSNDDEVTVSPSEFGAGLVSFTIVNLADTTTAVAITGPTDIETPEDRAGHQPDRQGRDHYRRVRGER